MIFQDFHLCLYFQHRICLAKEAELFYHGFHIRPLLREDASHEYSRSYRLYVYDEISK